MILNTVVSQVLKKTNLKLGLSLISTVLLAACGGGGGSSSSSSSSGSPTLNLNTAYTSWVKGGSTITGTIFGYCQGTRQQTFTPTVSGQTLSSAAALITYETETDTIPASSNAFCKSFYKYDGSTSTPYYFDPTYVYPITSGTTTQNGDPLGLVWSNQAAPPTSVTAGATGTLATYVNYGTDPLDSSRSIPENEGSRTWMIVADTTTTLMYVTIDIAKIYSLDGKGPLIYTSITNYRINANNTLTPLFKQVQATNIATQGQGNQTIYENYKQ